MTIEQYPLSEFIGCRAYFGFQKKLLWQIEAVYEEVDDSSGERLITSETLTLLPLFVKRTRANPLKKTLIRYCDQIVILPGDIIEIKMTPAHDAIRYITNFRTITVFRRAHEDIFHFAA